MKNPILAVGILFFMIFMYQLRDKGIFESRISSLLPTSCKPVKIRLEKYMHKSWDISCNENNLVVVADVDDKLIKDEIKDMNMLKAKMYKALANTYITISKYSPSDSLERTMIISVKLKHPKLILNSISEGKHVYNLKDMKNFKMISQHIKSTIQVQEVAQ